MLVIRLRTKKEYEIQHVKIKHERKQCLLPTPADSKEELTSLCLYPFLQIEYSRSFSS